MSNESRFTKRNINDLLIDNNYKNKGCKINYSCELDLLVIC